MLEYKAVRYGRTFTKVDRFLPSSQTCSECGAVDGPQTVARAHLDLPGVPDDPRSGPQRGPYRPGGRRADRKNACGGAVRPAA
uniref:zinc ribbon domain-containing protein n=1 Tax=Nocardiopsis kunsanensis TaxID=141693 RepID=UPI0030840164